MASGVDVKRMVVVTMLLSGAVAGLIGLPAMFSDSFNYGSVFQTGLGFTGIAVALLGRNHPVGIALGALIFAFLSEQANLLNILAGISPDIVDVTQGVIVLAVVIAYEVVRRYRVRLEQAQVAPQLADQRRERRTPSPRRWPDEHRGRDTAPRHGRGARGRELARHRRIALYVLGGFVLLSPGARRSAAPTSSPRPARSR